MHTASTILFVKELGNNPYSFENRQTCKESHLQKKNWNYNNNSLRIKRHKWPPKLRLQTFNKK